MWTYEQKAINMDKRLYPYDCLVWVFIGIHCELKIEKQDLQTVESWS